MSSSNHIKNVALVGATGNSGSHMLKALLATGKHTVTALTRKDGGGSKDLPAGVTTKPVDYADVASLTEALRGQDALVIALAAMAPPETQPNLLRAAAAAGVPWVMPNEWSPDCGHEGMRADVPIFARASKATDLIRELGVSSYVAMTCGFWYEWSLAIAPAYGFDIPKRQVTFFDDGRTITNTSTWPQVGRAVAALLSLPVKSEGDPRACLDAFRNRNARISSFRVSQEDMLESLLRVTGTRRADWTVAHENARERWQKGTDDMKAGDRIGFVKNMYTRVFFDDGAGDYETRLGLDNEVLGLPREEIDVATAVAVERSKQPAWH